MQWWIGLAHTMAIFYEMMCDSATAKPHPYYFITVILYYILFIL